MWRGAGKLNCIVIKCKGKGGKAHILLEKKQFSFFLFLFLFLFLFKKNLGVLRRSPPCVTRRRTPPLPRPWGFKAAPPTGHRSHLGDGRCRRDGRERPHGPQPRSPDRCDVRRRTSATSPDEEEEEDGSLDRCQDGEDDGGHRRSDVRFLKKAQKLNALVD